ncbi:hypothetical protein [Nocardioides pantholopis]|uniref:hypothetical protein n=1 Tax=Nocardioides pantholopis TaxID=2483798 RepID=UPI000FD7B7CE|nr:hypothetical protein [Nocardioides pantholopis]
MSPPRRWRAWVGNPLVGLPAAAAAVALLSVVGLVLLGLPVLGLGGGDDGERGGPDATPAGPDGLSVAAARTPAHRVLARTFAALPGDWEPQGELLAAASVPHPLACVDVVPTVALSRTHRLGGDDVQVTVAAYAAGVGADALARMVEEVAACAPSAVGVTPVGELDLGAEGIRLAVSGTDTDYRVLVWRRGDVLGFVSGTVEQSLDAAAAAADDALAPELAAHCVTEGSTREDALRNAAYAGGRFTGRVERRLLRGDRVPVPEVPPAYATAGVVATPLPAPPAEAVEVNLPAVPAHPHWPDLPAPVAEPDRPEPVVPQRTEMRAPQRVPDPDGPGCGWAFTATAEPDYDNASVERENTAAIRRTREALTADGERWRVDVLAYWIAHRTYLDQVAAWNAYAAEVEAVAAAWAVTEQAWAAYEAAHAQWEVTEKDRTDLLEDQDQAREQYADQGAQCLVWYEADPNSVDYLLNCPPEVPQVLSTPVPVPLPEPQPPADPRPAGQ